jgi:hypothetical protein
MFTEVQALQYRIILRQGLSFLACENTDLASMEMDFPLRKSD